LLRVAVSTSAPQVEKSVAATPASPHPQANERPSIPTFIDEATQASQLQTTVDNVIRGVGVPPAQKNEMQNKPQITTNKYQSDVPSFVLICAIRGFFFTRGRDANATSDIAG
jgi:hypothetical protein